MLDKEFIQLLYTKLNLANYCEDTQTTFLAVMTRYLNHGRKDSINGRTLNFLEQKLEQLATFLRAINLSSENIIPILINMPTILNILDDLYVKYLFLGVLENKENSIRKEKLVNKTKDYMVGVNKIFARYCLIKKSSYDKANWNNLVHASDKEFASIFVKSKYEKSYQMFSSIEEVMAWLSNIDLEDMDFNEIKSLKVNKEIVARYEGKKEKNGWNL